MVDKKDPYDGDYGGYPDKSFKRKNLSESDGNPEGDHESNIHPVLAKANEYVKELLSEKLMIDQKKLPNAAKLVDQEITKVQQSGKIPQRDVKYVDIYREKPIKVTVKVLVPVREHPKFNFVGKLLGPKGNSMKRLQEDTMCKMAVLGKGSMKDRQKEDELRNSLDPKYAHLSDDLHVEISALGPPAEAHARIAFALAEVRKYLIPDNNDNIRQEQMREMEMMGEAPPEREYSKRSILRDPAFQSLKPRAPKNRSPEPRSAPEHIRSMPRPSAPMRTATRSPIVTRPVMPAKTKIMSILDRARIAMEESAGYDDDPYESGVYERYSHPSSKSHSSHYYGYEYEPEYYRESSGSYDPSSSSRSWKHKSPSSSVRHTESSRYRTSPYTRPSK